MVEKLYLRVLSCSQVSYIKAATSSESCQTSYIPLKKVEKMKCNKLCKYDIASKPCCLEVSLF